MSWRVHEGILWTLLLNLMWSLNLNQTIWLIWRLFWLRSSETICMQENLKNVAVKIANFLAWLDQVDAQRAEMALKWLAKIRWVCLSKLGINPSRCLDTDNVFTHSFGHSFLGNKSRNTSPSGLFLTKKAISIKMLNQLVRTRVWSGQLEIKEVAYYANGGFISLIHSDLESRGLTFKRINNPLMHTPALLLRRYKSCSACSIQ